MVRRMLLILVTGLIVARPFLVAGEDPTLESPLPGVDTSGLLLTMLWFVAAVLWAVWRVWARQGNWTGGLLEAALFAVVLLTSASALFVAPYKFPARLMAWEWGSMAVGFFLVRQLAASRQEQHYFFAVLLSGMVVLSVYALWQRGVEIPKQHKLDTIEKLRQAEVAQGGEPASDDFLREKLRRVQENYVYGTYANPNSFAGYLALLLPGLIGVALLCARHKHPRWQVMIASCFATIGVVALGLTISRGAWLATLLAGLGTVALIWRDWVRRQWYYAAGVVVVLGLIAFGISRTELWTTAIGKTEGTALVRFKEYWPATWEMIQQHPWFGVGPGQFGRYYPQYMSESAGETIKEPHNFVLEIWATCGIFTVVALLAVFVLFYRRTLLTLLRGATVDGPDDLPHSDTPGGEPATPLRWEFYVGGMFGLLLASVLRIGERGQDDIIHEGVMMGIGALFWFGAFALFEQIQWSNRARLLVLVAGVTATLLNLLVSGGINFPSVAGLLWCAVALALNAADQTPNTWTNRYPWLLYVPVPVMAAVAVAYLMIVFYPVTTTVHQVRVVAQRLQDRDRDSRKNLPLGAIAHTIFSEKDAVEPLDKVRQKDAPDYAPLCTYLANMEAALWILRGDAAEITKITDQDTVALKAIKYTHDAQMLDPVGLEGYYAEYNLRILYANSRELQMRSPALFGLGARVWQITISKRKKDYERYIEERKQQYYEAAKVVEELKKRDPNNAQLHYKLADCLYRADRPKEAREPAERALYLNKLATRYTRKLSDEQVKQLEHRLAEE